MGATLTDDGVNFAVFSAHATALELCLYAADSRHEIARLPFTEREGDVWHLHVSGIGDGQLYGLRAHGPYAPDEGHRFNPHKLLIDPYAKDSVGQLRWSDALYGYTIGSKREGVLQSFNS
jgi:glycogen operon protein